VHTCFFTEINIKQITTIGRSKRPEIGGYTMKKYIIELKWTVSRARDTYGYNVVTLTDNYGAKFKASGGGYDMTGKVFGQWLEYQYMDKIKAELKSCVYGRDENGRTTSTHSDYYGLFYDIELDKYWLDGACGLDSMRHIAKAIGLDVTYACHKGDVKTMVVIENLLVGACNG
jgi:hypothetical protein